MTSMVSLDLEKGSVRMRRLQDKTNEYVVPCHMESISAMKLSDSGEYLATCCHDGLFIRVWGWKVTPGGNEEQEPRPLYMIDTQPKAQNVRAQGQIIDLQLSADLKFIAASFMKIEVEEEGKETENASPRNFDEKVTNIVVFGPIDHLA